MNSELSAHSQITPIDFKYTPEIMDKFLISPSKEVYKIIYEGSLATLEEPSIFKINGFVLNSQENSDNNLLFTSCSFVKEGWLGVDNFKRQEYKKNFLNTNIMLNECYKESEKLEFDDFTVYPVEKPYLKLDEFITALEKYHIGKPSTYGSIFENLEKNIQNGFVEKNLLNENQAQKESFIYEITEKCEDFLEKFSQMNDPFLNLKNSKNFEMDLKKYADGKLIREEFEKKYFKIFPEQFLNKIDLSWIDDCL